MVAQTDFFLVGQPLIIKFAGADVDNLLFEAAADTLSVLGIWFAVWPAEGGDQVRGGPNEVIPNIENV